MPKLVVLDVDGTLTKVRSSWQYVHERLGIWTGQAEKYQEMFRRGEISYREFCELDARLWRGIPLKDVLRIIDEIEYREGIEEFFSFLKDDGRKFALVSTGLSFLVEKIREEFDLEFAFSNRLVHDGSVLTGEVEVCVDWHEKPQIVRRLKSDLGIKREEVVVLGDSDGDLEMFDAAGLRIAVEPTSRELERKADFVLEDGNLIKGVEIIRERFGNRV